MRIVYDFSGITMRPSPTLPSSSDRTVHQSVLVIRGNHASGIDASKERATGSLQPQAQLSSNTRYKTSDQALARDQVVRGHEKLHLSALGPYAASAIQYQTRPGADGQSIAVGGRIAVDVSPVPGDPEATLRKARTILGAATAPGDPSSADQRVAAQAYRLMQQAQKEMHVNLLT